MSIEYFDEYVSLGNRCETAFQIQRILGKEETFSSFFNWNVTGANSLIALLERRFSGILEVDNLTPNEWLVHDSAGDYAFHLIGEGRKSKDHPQFLSDLDNHKRKVAHIIEQYFALAQSDKRVCYFHRSEEMGDLLPMAIRLRAALEAIHGRRNFAIVFIQQEEARAPGWTEEGLFNRYAKRLAAVPSQDDSHILSWDAIFREFPRRGRLNFCYWV